MDVVVLIAAATSVVAVLGLLLVVGRLGRLVRELHRISDDLRGQTVPLVAEANRVVGHAATELDRVGAVLDSTGSVHSTIDSASRLAYRAFANPVVKVLAVRAGAAGGLRSLRSGAVPESSKPSVAGRTRGKRSRRSA